MMRPYNELTKIGKIRRMHQLALKALEKYDLCIEWISFLTIATNTMFLIRSIEGRKFVLRIYSDEETTLKENQAEMFWLDALKRDTNLKVTEPIACRNGEYINIVSVPSVPGERRCVLFNWIPGQTLENHLSSENYYKYGQLLAKLHNHASMLKPLPTHIQPKKWDKVFYYPDEPVVYDIPEYNYLFPSERIELIKKVIVHADDVFARLFEDKAGQILIHGDLHYRNVHFYRGELYALDFEDVNFGYPVQDIAVTLYYGRQHDGYNEWKAAFKQGYCSVRRWPTEGERTIETLMAARSVMFINYVARINPSPQEYIEKKCEELVRFLKTYG